MAQIGTTVLVSPSPPTPTTISNTANAFMVGFSDWGPIGSAGVTSPVSSLAAAAKQIAQPNGGLTSNSRNANNATLWDSCDAFFREGGKNLYLSRVVGPAPTFGSFGLQDASANNSAILTAQYVGAGSSAINVVVNNTGAAYVITLQDTNGNVLATSPSLTTTASPKADLVNWAAGTGLVTAVASAASLPKTASAAPLSAGTDGRNSASLSNWSSALAGFGLGLGPGQVMAPGQANTALSGIWNALATHAQSNNRMALLDGTDGNTATAAITEITTAAISSGLQSYCGLWVGNLKIPGITSGTARVIPPSPVVAALCARADGRGNPNLAAAGTGFPLQYVSGQNTAYTGNLTGDIATLNDNGANVFYTQNGLLQNFGFVSLLGLPTNDVTYWQLNHGRLRMAIVNSSLVTGQPFQFAQVDGQGITISSFGGAMNSMLLAYFNVGALYGTKPSDAFTVDVGSTVNTPASLQTGVLQAVLSVRMSPFAQLVEIVVNTVPITQNLVQSAS